MKRILFTLATLMTIFTTAPAFACSCMPDNGEMGQQIANDSSMSAARVLVRGVNTQNGQSMLQLKETLTGGLMARNFRAKFDAMSSCGVVPQAGREQVLLIKFEKDGTYSIPGQCSQMAIQQYLKNQ